MGRYARLLVGALAGAAVGYVVYSIIKKRRTERATEPAAELPRPKRGKLIAYPSSRPPFAEAAEVIED